ncbi:MAG: GAF domain-containing protein [Rhodococcus sp. (in: high G+C Gram-positive bacteria)]|uniref:GAF domain-containing protein n=1 Tax=Rhodococcus sp. EPR-157 TaxID=1813677 RepID=UPI000839A83F|nr:GAF domain-containing protein [Rhodococcus sp. EPR-157]
MTASSPEWTLIETLVPGTIGVVAKGGHPKSLHESLSLQRLSPDPKIAVEPFLTRAIGARGPYEETIDIRNRGGSTTYRLLARPVMGPTGAVHALQMWIGPADRDPGPPRTASGVSWLLDRGVIAQTLEASLMSGVEPEAHVPERTPAEYYAKSIRFDDTAGLFTLCLAPTEGGAWEGSFSVLHADGRVMRWHCHARACLEPGEVGVRVLWHDVTDTVDPDKPILDVLARQSGMDALGIYPALLVPRRGYLAMWLCDTPAPWVQWRDVSSGNDVFHPDDRVIISEAHSRLLDGGNHEEITVRTRAATGPEVWIATRMRISLYPGDLGEHLAVVDMYRD